MWWDERSLKATWLQDPGAGPVVDRNEVGPTSEEAKPKETKPKEKVVWTNASLEVDDNGQANLTANTGIKKGTVLWKSNEYYLSVLFDDFCGTHCGACFSEIAEVFKSDTSPKAQKLKKMLLAYPQLKDQILKSYTWSCKECNGKFLLCGKCENEDAKQWHKHECELFCNVPEAMRSGHTDYLRFGCRFFSICKHGAPPACLPGSRLLKPTSELRKVYNLRSKANVKGHDGKESSAFLDCLDTNRKLQPEHFTNFCVNMAKTFERYVPFPDDDYTVEHLIDLLMRIRTNALGFPCSDKFGSLGWSLDLYASFLDHSCVPNCRVDMNTSGDVVVQALSDIKPHSKLFISYAIESRTPQERREHLYDLYRFHCKCELCMSGK